MAVQLGSAFAQSTPESASLDGFARAIAAEVQRAVEARLAEMDKRIGQVASQKQPVSVQPSTAQVHVAAPDVTVTPSFTVNVPEFPELPEIETINCVVEMPGCDRLAAVLEELLVVLKSPVEKVVSRDRGVIVGVTERRVG